MVAVKKLTVRRKSAMGAVLALLLTIGMFAGASPASAATSPTTSPTVSTAYVGVATAAVCDSGYFCAFVENPNMPGYYEVFSFYNCGSYSLYNWSGAGYVVNHQSGGAVANIYNASGGVVHSYAATDTLVSVSGGWTPIYYIRPC
jgi:hypothetical protein